MSCSVLRRFAFLRILVLYYYTTKHTTCISERSSNINPVIKKKNHSYNGVSNEQTLVIFVPNVFFSLFFARNCVRRFMYLYKLLFDRNADEFKVI